MSERLTEAGVARLGAVPVLGLVLGLALGLALGWIVRSSAPRSHKSHPTPSSALEVKRPPCWSPTLSPTSRSTGALLPVGLRDRFRSRHAYARHTSTGPTAGLVSQPGRATVCPAPATGNATQRCTVSP